MADSTQRLIFVPRASIDVNANSGEVAGEGFGGNADTIWEGGDLVKFDRILFDGG